MEIKISLNLQRINLMTKENKIAGLILDGVPAEVELEAMLEKVYIIVVLRGAPQPIILDVTNEHDIRNMVLASLSDESINNIKGNCCLKLLK